MSSKLEDQIWEFIAKHRSLKFIFLIVAGVGILSAAINTIVPVWNQLSSLADRYRGVSPPNIIEERYGCAFKTGHATASLPGFGEKIDTLEPSNETMKVLTPYVNGINTIAKCETLFGFSPVNPAIPIEALLTDPKPGLLIRKRIDQTNSSTNQFEFFLSSKDHTAASLLRVGMELVSMQNQLLELKSSNQNAFFAP